MSRALAWISAFALVAIIGVILKVTALAGSVGAGYAAKQICSGVFVSRLPESFVVGTDVLPRLATVGPLAGVLQYEVNETEGLVRASMLGQGVVARHSQGYGCTLMPSGTMATLQPVANIEHSTRDSTSSAVISPGPRPILDAALDNAFLEIPDGGRNTLAVVVMHRGEIVAERYKEPVTAATPMQGWSMNKSLMATFIGHQFDKGRLRLDDPVRDALLAADVGEALLTNLPEKLTLQHLLSMTTGFGFSERYFPGDDVTNMLYRHEAMWQSAPRSGHTQAPGSRFSYSSGDINTASLMWQQSLGEQSYPDWIANTFVEPLGMETITLEPDASGVQVGSSYAYLAARDWAKMGQLWLDAWHGRSELISQRWQRMAVTPGSATNGDVYGLGFWLNTGLRAFPSAPETAFYAGGNSGQFVVVLPDQELVVVRLGLTLDESQADLDALLNTLLSTL